LIASGFFNGGSNWFYVSGLWLGGGWGIPGNGLWLLEFAF